MIIDAHTHFYDPSRSQGVDWPPADDTILYRTVLPQDFLAVASPHGVRSTVVVEASHRLEDNDWILDLAAREPSIVAFVGNVDLRDAAAADSLRRLSANPLFVGVRVRGIDNGELLSNVADANLSVLEELDLSLDLLVQPSDLAVVGKIARSHPRLRIVIDHVAHVPIDGHEPDRHWHEGMAEAAEHERVSCKVSRLTEAAVDWPASPNPEFYRPTLTSLIDLFGSARLLYGSNWPVCDHASDYATGLSVVRSFLEERSIEERDDILWRTAKRVYRTVERDQSV